MKHILLIIITLFSSLCLSAQSQDVTLVVSGQGNTREEATANALRSAIEQSYGVFVSANTQILNDEIIKDEIATVASGNVKEYKELSCMTMPNGMQSVTLSATVSISNLISYAKSHGSSAEFAGQTFMMNINLRKLNKLNELKALQNLRDQVRMMAPSLFDYKIDINAEPKLTETGDYRIDTEVSACPNDNFVKLREFMISTLKAVSLTEEEAESWRRNNMDVYENYQGYEFRNIKASVDPILVDIVEALRIAIQSWMIKVEGSNFFATVSLKEDPNNSHKNLVIKKGSLPYYPRLGYIYEYLSNFLKKGIKDIKVFKCTMKVSFWFNEYYLSQLTGFKVKPNYEWYEKVVKIPYANKLEYNVSCYDNLTKGSFEIWNDNIKLSISLGPTFSIREGITYNNVRLNYVSDWVLLNENDEWNLVAKGTDENGNKVELSLYTEKGLFKKIVLDYKGKIYIAYNSAKYKVADGYFYFYHYCG